MHTFTIEQLLADAPPPLPAGVKRMSWPATKFGLDWERERRERTKVCSMCRVRLPLTRDWWVVDSLAVDGFRSECRACRKARRAERAAARVAGA